MKTLMIPACLALLGTCLVEGGDDHPDAPQDAKRLHRELPSTWECVSQEDSEAQDQFIKHVTPTHFTWVTYDRENKRVLAVGGGTWSLRDGEYVEDCEFATEDIPQIRGGSFPYEYRIDGDRWIVKGGPNRGIREDETWTRVKRPNP